MEDTQLDAFCTRCANVRTYRKFPVDHRLHLSLTVVTVGLWLPIYLIVLLRRFRMPGTCRACGKPRETPIGRKGRRMALRATIDY